MGCEIRIRGCSWWCFGGEVVEGREKVRGVAAESGEGVEVEHSMAWEGLVELSGIVGWK